MSSKWMILAGAAALAANDGIAAQEHAAPHQSDDVGPAPVRLSRVRLATGVELQVAETGPADGVPVLFLHGYPDSWYSFTPVLDRLPPGVRAIVPSQRGHGDSERPDCCWRIPCRWSSSGPSR